ncbi:metallophosphoesterase [Planococcus sp. CPCC 101016]|uniref:metallophosphoesterase family protein n=1 Tax=Planococcus sp. CPCC 101016 TaxID=2599617 RepID=UPI0011B40774|nr:metallophosphoesterase [Planococcus sp. CPCC 101016]TWT07875.1 metallophosphoesterase [Planococcus sp. CPCC 101016]
MKGAEDLMKIAVIGDLHYPTLKESYSFIKKDRQLFYEIFLENFFSIPADLYVSIGDLTNFGTQDELADVYSIIEKHGKPFKHVLGNHDVYGMTRKEVLAITGQQGFHHVSTEFAELAFLDTAQEQNFANWGGTLDEVQQNWLSAVIKKTENRPLLVFGHHPIYGTTKNSTKDKRCIHPDIPIWEILSKKQGVGLYINGHNHFNSIAARENWTFLQLAAVLDEQAIRLIKVSDSLLSIDYISFDQLQLQKHAQVIGDAIDHFRLNSCPLGTAADVKYNIPLTNTYSLASTPK